MHPKESQRASRPARGRHRRELGVLGEDLAVAHLERRGFSVIARNVRTRHGEIDVIAFDGEVLVFGEVKCLRAGRSGPPTDPLTGLRHRQRARLRRLAVAWLSEAGAGRPRARTIRFDAIGVTVDRRERLLRLEHLEAAW